MQKNSGFSLFPFSVMLRWRRQDAQRAVFWPNAKVRSLHGCLAKPRHPESPPKLIQSEIRKNPPFKKFYEMFPPFENHVCGYTLVFHLLHHGCRPAAFRRLRISLPLKVKGKRGLSRRRFVG
jgi:hypothetical protein